jgi:hypothetical protein
MRAPGADVRTPAFPGGSRRVRRIDPRSPRSPAAGVVGASADDSIQGETRRGGRPVDRPPGSLDAGPLAALQRELATLDGWRYRHSGFGGWIGFGCTPA